MMTMQKLEQKLHKADRKQARLYIFCNFMALMLISAYSAMIFSPTVLNVLPEGGDSRKQMVMVFVLALFGCAVFTVYAASLFFRKKSRQLGTLMALGASKKRLAPGVFTEVLGLSIGSSLAGILAGFPFVWILWNLFRLFLIDSAEMALKFDFRCLLISVPFFLMVIVFSCLTAYRYLQKTNIMDVVHEEHKNEPVRELGRWCGPAGIALLLIGAVAGYSAPSLYMNLFSAYPPVWINLAYAPVFVGLYMIMLHTVVHGWRSHKRKPYKNIIARSMMKFQGRQTVNNLLVSTVLIAGACFAVFYIPMMGAGQIQTTRTLPYDYFYQWRADQNIVQKPQVESLAADYQLTLKDWTEGEYLTLGMDGETQIEEGNGHFHYEYEELLNQGKFLSEDTFNAISGQHADVKPGTYYGISNENETGTYFLELGSSKLTNMVTRKNIETSFAGFLHFSLLTDSIGYYVLDNADYDAIAAGLSDDWKGKMAVFNIDGEDSYAFADDFFHTLVTQFGPECEIITFYDRVAKIRNNEAGNVYWGDTDDMTKISYSNPDSSDFRAYWSYMPVFRVLNQNDFLQNYAVFLMMFLFIAIICLLSALIISYTRCQTIAINNRYIFDDLKMLGASPAFLTKEVQSQCSRVFKTPTMVGMGAMYLLYGMMMFANDGGKLDSTEILGLAICLGILVLLAALFYLVYRKTVQIIIKQLGIK